MLPCDGPELNVADRPEPQKDARRIRNDSRLRTFDSGQPIIVMLGSPEARGKLTFVISPRCFSESHLAAFVDFSDNHAPVKAQTVGQHTRWPNSAIDASPYPKDC